jgi:hypothetical protein
VGWTISSCGFQISAGAGCSPPLIGCHGMAGCCLTATHAQSITSHSPPNTRRLIHHLGRRSYNHDPSHCAILRRMCQVLDDLEPSDSRPSWNAPEVYREKYGFRFTDLHLIENVCPPCARVLAIGRRESLPETVFNDLPSAIRLLLNYRVIWFSPAGAGRSDGKSSLRPFYSRR